MNWVYGILTTIAVLVTIVVCVVEGIKSKKRNPTDYLLLVNIVCKLISFSQRINNIVV